jgi:hypothetical protein
VQLSLQCFAKKQIEDMNRHQPWVMKDPRMALTMPLWRRYIPSLVCVYVHKSPIANSISLASNGKKSSQSGAESPQFSRLIDDLALIEGFYHP